MSQKASILKKENFQNEKYFNYPKKKLVSTGLCASVLDQELMEGGLDFRFQNSHPTFKIICYLKALQVLLAHQKVSY